MHGNMQKHARVAQLVERDLAKVEAAGSSPVSRSYIYTKKGVSERMLLFSCKKSPKGSSQWNELKFIPGSRSQPIAIKPDRFYQLISSRRIDACASTASARLVAITWSGLRSAQNRGPSDLVRRLALFYYTRRSIQEDTLFLYHKIFSDRQVMSKWNAKVTIEVDRK